MAYDRHDTRHGSRGDHDRWSDDRHGGRQRSGSREERGFFERAGDEIASWFGDDDDRGGHPRHRERHHGGRDHREMGRDSGWTGGRDREEERNWFGGRNRDDRGFGGRDRDDNGGWLGSESYRGVSGESGYTGGSSTWLGGGRDPDRDRDYRPMTGDYGRSERFGPSRGFDRQRERGGRSGRPESNWDRDEYRRTSFAGSSESSQHHDPHYDQWRERQLQELDRDYDEYHRERQSKFENDFGSWRERRQQKRQTLGQVRDQMEIVGNDGEHVGTVDKVAGDRIILAKSEASGGAHHSLSCSDVDRVEDNRVILDCAGDEAKKRWQNEDRTRALFERPEQGEAGPHMLDRSFSGTYRS